MWKLLWLSFLWLCFTPVSFSQGIRDSTFRLQQVQVTAHRAFKKEEAGMTETRVDSVVLTEKTGLSLSELLSENTPVFIKSHGRGALSTASFRGTAPSHAQVTWNGLNINSPMTGMVDFSLIPVYLIDELNLKHGSASIADQSGGLGGSINMGNLPDWDKQFKLKYLQGVGSYGTFDEFIQMGGAVGKLRTRTRIYHNHSTNDYSFINYQIGDIDPNTGEIVYPRDKNKLAAYTRYGLLQEFYYRLTSNNTLSAKYWGQYADRGIPRVTSFEGEENANVNHQRDEDHKVVVDWKHYTDKGKLMVRSGYSQKYLLYTLINKVSGSGSVAGVYSVSHAKSLLNNITYTCDLNDRLSLEGSIDVNSYAVDSRDTVKATGYDETRTDYSAFLALRKNFIDRINVNFMLRQDRVDGDWSPVVPFVGFDFRVIKDGDFLLKGNVAGNHHQPTLNDLFWQPGGNPNLLPEDGFSVECGAEYQKQWTNMRIEGEVTGYRSDIDHWIVWIPSFNGSWEPMNIKRVLSQGVEAHFALSGKWGEWNYRTSGAYAYTRSTNYGDPFVWGDESYGKQLVYIPLHSGNLMFNISRGGFFLTYQNNWYSERYTTSSNDVSKRQELYPYYMNDVFVGKAMQIGRLKMKAEFKVYNLFNESYHSVLYRPMPRRNYLLLLTLNI